MSSDSYIVKCDGPGPHSGDGSGVLGHADQETHGFYCASDVCTEAMPQAGDQIPIEEPP